MTPLLTPSGAYDRAAIMRNAWRDFRRVRALGDVEMTLGDWLRNAWRVAKAQRTGNVLATSSNHSLALRISRAAFVPASADARDEDRSVYFAVAHPESVRYLVGKPMDPYPSEQKRRSRAAKIRSAKSLGCSTKAARMKSDRKFGR
jgi:hypothetical protein